MTIPTTANQPQAYHRRFGKWDASYLESVQLRQPFATFLRSRGHKPNEIESAQRQLPRIRKRLDAMLMGDKSWQEEKRLLLRDLRRETFERLRTRKTKSMADDLRLLELIERMLKHPDQEASAGTPTQPLPAMSGPLSV